MASSIEIQQTNAQDRTNPHRIRVLCVSPSGFFDPKSKRNYLKEQFVEASIRELLFNMRKDGDNYWIGAAVPEGANDFSNVQVFFHPKPTNGGALDQDYARLASHGWRAKYDHMWYLGVQLAVVRKTALLYPFMRESAFIEGSSTFMFASRPRETLSEIVSAVQAGATGKAGPVSVGRIGVSGFSSGVDGMKRFAAALGSSVVETTDFDGPFRTGASRTVWSAPGALGRVITQTPPKVADTPGYLYLPAWKFKFITKTPFAENVHKQIGYLTFLVAMAQSRIV